MNGEGLNMETQVYSTLTGRSMYIWNTVPKGIEPLPVTCVRFKPKDDSKTKNVVLVAGAYFTMERLL